VLGLAEEIDCDDEGIGELVGHHQDLGRSREQVNADLTEQLSLRLRDVGVAGAGDEVDFGDGLGAQRQGGHRLDSAKQPDLGRARQVHRRHRGRGDLAPDRRRAGADVLNPRHLGSHDRHVR
jgi:hypothetical protein